MCLELMIKDVYLKSISEELACNGFRQAPLLRAAGQHDRAALRVFHHQQDLAAPRIICTTMHLSTCLPTLLFTISRLDIMPISCIWTIADKRDQMKFFYGSVIESSTYHRKP